MSDKKTKKIVSEKRVSRVRLEEMPQKKSSRVHLEELPQKPSVHVRLEEIPEKRMVAVWRILFVLTLVLLNAGIWAYFFFKIRVMCDESAFSERVLEQTRQEKIAEQRQKMEAQRQRMIDAVAIVNGEPITLTDVQNMVNEMPQLAELPFETVYPNLLEMIINNRVVMQGAADAGIPERPEVKRQLRHAKEQIIGQTYLDELLTAQVTEAELRALYDQEMKNFRREEEIHARHILVKTKQEAEDILVQLKAGANFAELADKKSLDENTEGGDLGYFTKGMMIPEFGDIVFDMKKGQLSDPIKTPFGWHIVLIEDKRLANPPSFEELRPEIQRAVMETKMPAVLNAERVKMKVQVLKPTLE